MIQNYSLIAHVTISSSLISIGKETFLWCSSSIVSVEEGSFMKCISYESNPILYSVTKIGNNSFEEYQCSLSKLASLVSVELTEYLEFLDPNWMMNFICLLFVALVI